MMLMLTVRRSSYTGRFYDAAGKATPALKKVKEKLQKAKIVYASQF
jgi:hypothetical protein